MRAARERPGSLRSRYAREAVSHLHSSDSNGQARLSWRERWAKFAARTRVPVCIALAVTACVLSRPTAESLLTGILIGTAGLAIRGWAAGHLRKNEELAVSGPYARVRNPLYIGSLLAGVGLGVATAHVVLLAVIVTVFLAWFLPVVREEEDHMRKILPGFIEYEQRVPRFLPAVGARYASRTRFEWRLFLRNREYTALLGFAVLVAILGLKLILK